jgi:hypothetical protein
MKFKSGELSVSALDLDERNRLYKRGTTSVLVAFNGEFSCLRREMKKSGLAPYAYGTSLGRNSSWQSVESPGDVRTGLAKEISPELSVSVRLPVQRHLRTRKSLCR